MAQVRRRSGAGGGLGREAGRRLGQGAARGLAFYGGRGAGALGAHAQASSRRRPPGHAPWPNCGGLWRAQLGRSGAGADGPERFGPSGSARSSRIVFLFFRIYFNAKTIQKNLEIV
jgi:hypothetical protein